MGQTVHHYPIFETAAGFCGIAWNNVGITRFRLPTRSAEASERILLRSDARRLTRRANAGGDRGSRSCEALFRGRADFHASSSTSVIRTLFKQIYAANIRS